MPQHPSNLELGSKVVRGPSRNRYRTLPKTLIYLYSTDMPIFQLAALARIDIKKLWKVMEKDDLSDLNRAEKKRLTRVLARDRELNHPLSQPLVSEDNPPKRLLI